MADDNPNRGLPAGIIHEYPVADPLFPPGAAQNVGPEGIVPYMQMVPNMIMAPVVMPPIPPPLAPTVAAGIPDPSIVNSQVNNGVTGPVLPAGVAPVQAPVAQPQASVPKDPAFPLDDNDPVPVSRRRTAKKKALAPVGKNSKGGRGCQFSKEETWMLLRLIEDIMPVGHIDWDQCTNEFNAKVPADRAREKTALQRKFNLMKDAKVPTGNPNPPKAIMKAKELNELLIEKSESLLNAEAATNPAFNLNLLAADGDDEESTADEEGGSPTTENTNNTPAQNRLPVPRNISGTASYTSRKRAKVNQPQGNEDFMKMFMEQNRVDRERDRLDREERERAREARERREERKDRAFQQQQHAMQQQNQMMMMALLASLNKGSTPAFPLASTAAATATATVDIPSSDGTTSLSSINSSDSEPTVQAKVNAGRYMSASMSARLATKKAAPSLARGATGTPTKKAQTTDDKTPTRSNTTPRKRGSPPASKSLPTRAQLAAQEKEKKTMKTRKQNKHN
jgi:hypothetical protein